MIVSSYSDSVIKHLKIDKKKKKKISDYAIWVARPVMCLSADHFASHKKDDVDESITPHIGTKDDI